MTLGISEDSYYRAKLESLKREVPAVEQYRENPELYASEVLKVKWWGRQTEIARSVASVKRTLVKTGHGIGKSFVAAGLVNWWYDTRPNSVVVSTAPTYRQVTAVLWREIRSQRRTKPSADISQIRDPSDPAHYAMGYTTAKNMRADSYESQGAQGVHAKDLLAVIDEAGGVQPAFWQAFDGMAVGAGNHILAIGNPTVNSGPFFEAARSGKWNVLTVSVLEHPNILAHLEHKPDPYPGAVSIAWLDDKLTDPAWVEIIPNEASHDSPECFEFKGVWYKARPIAQSLILGQFPSETTDTVWAMAWIESARYREMRWSTTDRLEIGVDVARFGTDSTAMHARIGPCSVFHDSWSKESNTAVAGRVYENVRGLWDKHESHDTVIRVDTTGGHGAGPADLLRELFSELSEVQIVDVNSSGKPDDPERFDNVRSELWFALADRARDGQLDLTRLRENDYERLLSQFTAPKYKYSHGRRVVEAKEVTKAWLQRSPDDADAMNLAYYSGQSTEFPAPTSTPSRWTRYGGKEQEDQSWGPVSTGRGLGRWEPEYGSQS